VTLVGMGGIGKTRWRSVAAEVVDAYRDGVWFVDLVPRDPCLLSAVARVLGVREGGKPSTERAARRQLRCVDNWNTRSARARLAEAMLGSPPKRSSRPAASRWCRASRLPVATLLPNPTNMEIGRSKLSSSS
jgi:predicted ATPase